MSSKSLMIAGALIVVAAVAFGFVPVTDETYNAWRKTWMMGTWLGIVGGVALVAYGYYRK